MLCTTQELGCTMLQTTAQQNDLGRGGGEGGDNMV